MDSNTNTTTLVGFEVFTAVTTKNAIFWDVVPCRPHKNRLFGGTCRLYLQGRKNLSVLVAG
jgi:hypothetical protein